MSKEHEETPISTEQREDWVRTEAEIETRDTERRSTQEYNPFIITLAEWQADGPKKNWDHLMVQGHKVADLEQNQIIMLTQDEVDPHATDFETWCCMYRGCNYLEFRLKEGHREDR